MFQVRFVLIGEGSSDAELRPHLEKLCILAGADEVSGVAPDLAQLRQPVGRDIPSKVRAALELAPEVDLLFIHRDADQPDPEPRLEAIQEALRQISPKPRHVAVIPVQETEAWLLLDEAEIRRVAENPRGRMPLDLPKPSQVESIAQPKERLKELLLEASGQTGRRRQKIKKRFGRHRRLLLRRLEPEGPVSQVPAWQRFYKDLQEVLGKLQEELD